MAAPTVVAKGTANAATGTSCAPTLPASIAANDIIVANLISHQPVSVGAISGPGGSWSQIAQGTYQNTSTGANNGRAAWFWLRASGGESGTVTFTRTGDTGTDGVFYGNLYRITGCETSGDPWDQAVARYSVNGDSATVLTYDAVTVSGSERTLVAIQVNPLNTNGGPPTGYSENIASDGTTTGTDAGLDIDDFPNQSSDGSVNSGSRTSSALGWATIHISFKPPAAAGSLVWQPAATPHPTVYFP